MYSYIFYDANMNTLDPVQYLQVFAGDNAAICFIRSVHIFMDCLNGGSDVRHIVTTRIASTNRGVALKSIDSNSMLFRAFPALINTLHGHSYFNPANIRDPSNPNKDSFADISALMATNLLSPSVNQNILLEINKNYVGSIELLKQHTVISHGDLDSKNVLWNENSQPLLTDWESARKHNPTYEIVNAALDWSGITTDLNKKRFRKMLLTFKQAGGCLDASAIEFVFYGVIGNCINWMIYNINRSITSEDSEQKNLD